MTSDGDPKRPAKGDKTWRQADAGVELLRARNSWSHAPGKNPAQIAAESDLEVAVLTRSSLHGLVRSRPDIGTVVYRNLARGLGAKLRRADGVG